MIDNPNPFFTMDWKSNPNPITIHLIKENLKMPNIIKMFTYVAWLCCLRMMHYEHLISSWKTEIFLDLDWNGKTGLTIQIQFWKRIGNHNPIHQTGLQSGLCNPSIQSSNTLNKTRVQLSSRPQGGNSQNFLDTFVRFYVTLRCFCRVVIHRK